MYDKEIVQKGDLASIRRLVENDEDFDPDLPRLLFLALKWRKPDIVDYILEQGCPVDAVNEVDLTAIQVCFHSWADTPQDYEVFRLLMARNAPLKASGHHSLVSLAIQWASPLVVAELLSAGAVLGNAFETAIERYDIETAQLLLRHGHVDKAKSGAWYFVRNMDRETTEAQQLISWWTDQAKLEDPLLDASTADQAAVKLTAIMNDEDSRTRRFLEFVEQYGNYDVRHNGYVKNYGSLLHVAIYFDQLPACQALVDLGVDLNVVDRRGSTALQFAYDLKAERDDAGRNTIELGKIIKILKSSKDSDPAHNSESQATCSGTIERSLPENTQISEDTKPPWWKIW